MPQTVNITVEDLQAMIDHWLSTEPAGYLGSDYGSQIQELLQKALAGGVANDFLAKMRTDIPLLGAMPANTLDIFFQDTMPDKRNLFISVKTATGSIVQQIG
jgi:hypothetical protein